MYKVFIVDDEINIVHGIAKVVDWEGCQATLSGKAYHGQMALEMIQQDAPHIVLTDIKMPELNGIELIEKVQSQFPHVKFIILSGYDEFAFAKTAMKYGVKHYLLKPTNRKSIEKAIKEVILELEAEAEKERFIETIRQDLQKMVPIAKKQLLKEFIMNPSHEWKEFQQLFQMDDMDQQIRLLVMVIDQSHDFESLFALHEMVTKDIPDDQLYLSTTIGNKVVLLVKNCSTLQLSKQIKQIQRLFHEYYRLSFTIAISHPGKMKDVHQLYREANNCLTKRFYLGAGSVITTDDMKIYDKHLDKQFNYEDFIFSLRSGDVAAVRAFINHFFQHIKKENMDIALAKSYCLELLMVIMRHVSQDNYHIFFQHLLSFHEFQTLTEMKMFILLLATEVTKEHDQHVKHTHHQVIQKVLRYLDENIHDEQLTLTKVASEVVYMNPDYLGRLFKKEMGENFSSYLMKIRINKAIDLINQSKSVKIFEVADQVGFSNNPKYFGQVFKKYIGVTPTEYKQEMVSQET